MIWFLFLTALSVSIDSFVCGFSLSLKSGKRLPVIFGITLVVFCLCLMTNYLTAIFANNLSERTANLGGALLIAIGAYNLLRKNDTHSATDGTLKQSIISGFAVGMDGAVANLSLSLMGINAFYVPLTMALMHALMIWLGTILGGSKILKKFAKIELLSPFVLIGLGVYKLLGLFI